ncbi:MAG: HD domain-containing protein [Bacteroidales bacterium]|nr:HD domain-containing protein [Bacteroidales bacterium]
MNKKKIINDPVHGFINIPSDLIYDLLEHPIFQRLRRIKQLGLTHYVYPGATHTRFQHTIGAVHLMNQAIKHLQNKGIDISPEEEEAALTAILLHDIGHGPFSHALENSLIEGISHEDLSELLMARLNGEYGGRLGLALKVFKNQYEKKFLHQLVSSQLDMDRMDYLKRDSFFTGVVEGNIGTDRLIKMLDVHNDELAIEAKGIYSVEKFLLARRLMYWQVYYHKTVIASETCLVNIMQRAKQLVKQGYGLYATPALAYFLQTTDIKNSLAQSPNEIIDKFLELDDSDIMVSAKQWLSQPDVILKTLAEGVINRNLPKVEIFRDKIDGSKLGLIREKACKLFKTDQKNVGYLVSTNTITNSAYSLCDEKINIVFNNKTIKDISEVSDILNFAYINQPIQKHYFCFPKDCGE